MAMVIVSVDVKDPVKRKAVFRSRAAVLNTAVTPHPDFIRALHAVLLCKLTAIRGGPDDAARMSA